MAALTTAAEQGSTTVKTASMDEIRKHAADARWLDALDALDALSADEIDDEALAAECPLCGEAMVQSVSQPFIDVQAEAAVASSWAIA